MNRLYRQALRLLPQRRRARCGADMAAVFAMLAAQTKRESGWLGLGILWAKELAGLTRFAWRERGLGSAPGRLEDPSAHRSSRLPAELRWARRGVRARGARALLIVGLVGVALAANTLVFAAADALLFNRILYRDPDRLVAIEASRRPGSPGSPWMTADLFDQWRKQTDIFQSVHAYVVKAGVFLTGESQPEMVSTTDITPGLIEMLGVTPRWGRAFLASDAHEIDPIPALLSEELATRRFGAPAAAIGHRMTTTSQPLIVVGVMSASFRFPDGRTQLWRALDPRGPLTVGFSGVTSLARVAPGISLDVLKEAMVRKSAAIGASTGQRSGYLASPAPMRGALSPTAYRRLFLVLVGAAICLLLTACANVVSLELAGAMNRARTHAIQAALGASRATLVRVVLLEGAVLFGAAALLAAGLTAAGIRFLITLMPAWIPTSTPRPIMLDGRVALFMASGAALAWLLASIPQVLHASRPQVVGLLKSDTRSISTSRTGVTLRRVLTAIEVAFAVMLLVGSVLYLRTYQALIAVDKGFDGSNVVELSAATPNQGLPPRAVLVDSIIGRVSALPGVLGAVAEYAYSPFSGVKVQVDGQPAGEESISLTHQPIDPAYFDVLRIPVKSGRMYRHDEDQSAVVVTEGFARRYWANGAALGHRFLTDANRGWETVIGIVGDIHPNGVSPLQELNTPLIVFTPMAAAPVPQPKASPRPDPIDTGGSYGLINIMVRLDSIERSDIVLQTARKVDPRLRITLQTVNDKYDEAFSSTLFASRVVSAFGVLAFVVSMAGIFGVMAFLVAGRTREIGIRMALGAERGDISRSVLGSSMRLVGLGAIAGLAAALFATRWIQAELFGVSATDPMTYGLVTSAVVVTALFATWQPARQAARVDPAITLKAE